MSYMTTQDAQNLISDLIDEVWEAETPEKKSIYPKLVNVDEFGRGEYVNFRQSGLGQLAQREILEDIDYDTPDFGEKQTILPVNFGRGFRIAEETIEDLADAGPFDGINRAKIGTYSDIMRRWKRSCEWTVESQVANKFLNSTSTAAAYVGRDSLALCSASHVTLKNPTQTQSNVTTAASLTANNIMTGITAGMTQYDDRGDFVDASDGWILAVSPTNMFRAQEILKTSGQVDTANNNVNPLKGYDITPVVNPYFGPTYAGWWLINKGNNPVTWLWRKKPAYDKSQDFDAVALKYRVRMRGAIFHKDWRGIVGFPTS